MAGVYYTIVEDERGATLAEVATAGKANPIPACPVESAARTNWSAAAADGKRTEGSVPLSREGSGREDVTEELRVASAKIATEDLGMNCCPQYDPIGLAACSRAFFRRTSAQASSPRRCRICGVLIRSTRSTRGSASVP